MSQLFLQQNVIRQNFRCICVLSFQNLLSKKSIDDHLKWIKEEYRCGTPLKRSDYKCVETSLLPQKKDNNFSVFDLLGKPHAVHCLAKKSVPMKVGGSSITLAPIEMSDLGTTFFVSSSLRQHPPPQLNSRFPFFTCPTFGFIGRLLIQR